MPFKSEKQRRYMWAKLPEIAQKWSDEEKRSKSRRKRKRSSAGADLIREVKEERR